MRGPIRTATFRHAPPVLQRFLNNVELWLSSAGVVVVYLASSLFAPEGANVWRIAAGTALAVSVIHGVIFWVVRKRQRAMRERALAEIREMLADRVKNQLAVIAMSLPMTQDREAYAFAVEGINTSVDSISSMVDSLSQESLKSWKRHYREAVANATDLELEPAWRAMPPAVLMAGDSSAVGTRLAVSCLSPGVVKGHGKPCPYANWETRPYEKAGAPRGAPALCVPAGETLTASGRSGARCPGRSSSRTPG